MRTDPNLMTQHRQIRGELQAAARPEVLASMQRLVPGAKMLGVRVPEIRALAAKSAKTCLLPFETSLSLFDVLCSDAWREEVLFGIFLLARHKKHLREIPWKRIDGWLDHLDNWETCDQLASNVVAPAVAQNPTLHVPLRELTQSGNVWRQRFAVATVASLNQHGRFFPELTLAVCQDLMATPNPAIRKALGWAIRELCKKDEDAAFDFLWEHRKELSRTLLREASEKLQAGRRAQLIS